MKTCKITYLFTALFLIFFNAQACSYLSPEIAWRKADTIVNSIQATSFPVRYYPITKFGARSDNTTVSTSAINNAIKVCSEEGGGIVVVPAGTFLTGPIRLRSNVNLYLDEGAVLKFSLNPEDYLPVVQTRWEGVDCFNYSPLIYAYQEKNIAITGKGILDGQADLLNWWPWKGRKEYGWKEGMNSQSDPKGRDLLMSYEEQQIPMEKRVMGPGSYLRPPFIQVYDCEVILIENITIKNSPFWIIHPLMSKDIIIRGIEAVSHGPNNDGCDPESCENVLIENCFFDTGDDCIAVKSGRDNDGRKWNLPAKNIVIRKCIMRNGHGGITIGSEISGGCKNIFVENCEMNSPELDRAIRIKTNSFRGGTIEDVYIRNLKVGEVSEAVVRFECMYEIKEGKQGTFIPVIKNIHIQNVTSEKSKYALFLEGIPDKKIISDIHLYDCIFNGVEKGNRLVNTDDIDLKNVRINQALAVSKSAVMGTMPEGWASVSGGTTGGAGGDTILVNTWSELASSVKTDSPRIILIEDTIDLASGESINVKSDNITIMGKGDNAMIRNGGLRIYGDNVIIRNLSIGDSYMNGHWDGKGMAGNDAVTLYGRHIWIDHCDLYHCFDGLVDLSRNGPVPADLITVSWTRFRNHNKVILIGSSDLDSLSRGALRATIHHCWFDGVPTFYDEVDRKNYNLTQRMPRVRFGDVHVYNNYYENIEGYCIAARLESRVVAEANYFRNLEDPHIIDDVGKGIRNPELVAVNNIYDHTTGESVTAGSAFNPSDFYDYQPDNPSEIPSIVMNGAGKMNRKLNTSPVAINDTLYLTGNKNYWMSPLGNDSDEDNDSIRITGVLNMPVGEVKLYPSQILYTPPMDGLDSDVVVYQIIDFQGGTAEASVYIMPEKQSGNKKK